MGQAVPGRHSLRGAGPGGTPVDRFVGTGVHTRGRQLHPRPGLATMHGSVRREPRASATSAVGSSGGGGEGRGGGGKHARWSLASSVSLPSLLPPGNAQGPGRQPGRGPPRGGGRTHPSRPSLTSVSNAWGSTDTVAATPFVEALLAAQGSDPPDPAAHPQEVLNLQAFVAGSAVVLARHSLVRDPDAVMRSLLHDHSAPAPCGGAGDAADAAAEVARQGAAAVVFRAHRAQSRRESLAADAAPHGPRRVHRLSAHTQGGRHRSVSSDPVADAVALVGGPALNRLQVRGCCPSPGPSAQACPATSPPPSSRACARTWSSSCPQPCWLRGCL
jgi:hypothetical protein